MSDYSRRMPSIPYATILGLLMTEIEQSSHWPIYNSAHEVLGLLDEEFNKEFKEQVFLKQALRDPEKMKKELIQIAAVAVKAAALCDEEWVRK